MYLLVREARHRVNVFLLDHERSQVSSVGGQKDDSKEGPDQHHDLAGGSSGILHRHWVVKDNGPQEPDGFPYCEGGAARLWPGSMARKKGREKGSRMKCFLVVFFSITKKQWTGWEMTADELTNSSESPLHDDLLGGFASIRKYLASVFPLTLVKEDVISQIIKNCEAPIDIAGAPELLSRP